MKSHANAMGMNGQQWEIADSEHVTILAGKEPL